jgi:membrane-bound lytic murein transglycosylase A
LPSGCEKPPRPIAGSQQPKKIYDKPTEGLALRPARPDEIPDFSPAWDQRSGLEEAARYSLEYLSRNSSQTAFPYGSYVTHERAVASLEEFIAVLQSARSPQELDQQIKSRFEVFISRGCDEQGTVLFTGYYRPIFDARMQPDGEFRYPLYRKPADLAQDQFTGKYARQGGGGYYTRAEIDRGALANQGLELCYLRDRFEAYIVTVQGSGKLRLQDGSFFEIGYAGDNGHEYQSIGQSLVSSGQLAPEQLSLQGLIRHFKEHPEQLDQVLAINNRYVFFTPRTGGPYGSLNVPVTPFRSIATDKQVYPRACIAFMQTQLPARDASGSIQNYGYSAFALDQDTGGAIRAAGRCDVFMGTGPEVGELAGRTLAEGKLFYIFTRTGQPQESTQMTSPMPPMAPSAAPEAPMSH